MPFVVPGIATPFTLDFPDEEYPRFKLLRSKYDAACGEACIQPLFIPNHRCYFHYRPLDPPRSVQSQLPILWPSLPGKCSVPICRLLLIECSIVRHILA